MAVPHESLRLNVNDEKELVKIKYRRDEDKITELRTGVLKNVWQIVPENVSSSDLQDRLKEALQSVTEFTNTVSLAEQVVRN